MERHELQCEVEGEEAEEAEEAVDLNFGRSLRDVPSHTEPGRELWGEGEGKGE